MNADSTAFDWAAVDPAETAANDLEHEASLEGVRQALDFIAGRVLKRHNGELPHARVIAVRLIVLQALFVGSESRSLASYAKDLNCSRAWLSNIATKFSAELRLKAYWQRSAAVRAVYAERAHGVHRGDWQISAKHERDKRRRQQQATRAA